MSSDFNKRPEREVIEKLKEDLAAAQSKITELEKTNASLKEDIAEWEEAHKDRCKDWLYWKDQDARLREEIERLKGEHAPGKTSKGCRVCGLQFTDSLGRLTAMGYSCRRDDCPSRVIC